MQHECQVLVGVGLAQGCPLVAEMERYSLNAHNPGECVHLETHDNNN